MNEIYVCMLLFENDYCFWFLKIARFSSLHLSMAVYGSLLNVIFRKYHIGDRCYNGCLNIHVFLQNTLKKNVPILWHLTHPLVATNKPKTLL